MALTPEQRQVARERIQSNMNDPYIPVRDPSHMPSAEERAVQALEYIAYQLFEIRKALQK